MKTALQILSGLLAPQIEPWTVAVRRLYETAWLSTSPKTSTVMKYDSEPHSSRRVSSTTQCWLAGSLVGMGISGRTQVDLLSIAADVVLGPGKGLYLGN